MAENHLQLFRRYLLKSASQKNDGNDNPLSCRVTFCFQASLIGHMDNLGLLKSNTVFMEFGAGRGRYLRFAVIEIGLSVSILMGEIFETRVARC